MSGKFQHIIMASLAVLAMALTAGCSSSAGTSASNEITNAEDASLNTDKSIFSDKSTLLMASTKDLTSLTKIDVEAVYENEMPEMTENEWQALIAKVLDVEWEVSLNKRTKAIMDGGCRMINYKWQYYRKAERGDYSSDKNICITQSFKTLRGLIGDQSCLLRIQPVEVQRANNLTCESGGVKTRTPLVDFGSTDDSNIPARCKFRKNIVLNYPSCLTK